MMIDFNSICADQQVAKKFAYDNDVIGMAGSYPHFPAKETVEYYQHSRGWRFVGHFLGADCYINHDRRLLSVVTDLKAHTHGTYYSPAYEAYFPADLRQAELLAWLLTRDNPKLHTEFYPAAVDSAVEPERYRGWGETVTVTTRVRLTTDQDQSRTN